MSGPHSYDLLSERWIPVTWRNGAAGPTEPMVGIRQALNRSREIQCISHTSPFIEFGLYRLLITVVLDAYIVAGKRPTVGKMKAMIEMGSFNNLVLSEYLEAYKEGFDLWSEKHPFLQMPTANGKSDGIAKMIAPVPSGTKITFWHHYFENETGLSEGETARELCATAPFCFDYAPRDICTIGGDPPLYILVRADSLFETIVFNLPRPSGRLTFRQEVKGGPTWRCPTKDSTALPPSPTLAQGWTWPVRQVRLARSEGSSVVASAINVSGADKTAAKQIVRGWRDPHSGVISDSKSTRHIRANDLVPGFARIANNHGPGMLWRDLVPMCFIWSEGEVLRGQRIRSRPEVVTNALRITDGTAVRLAIYGFIDKGGRNNKLFRTWFRSVLTFPTEVARDSRLSAKAIDAFKTAQRVADDLRAALRILRAPSEAKKTAWRAIHRSEADSLSRFWQRLELPLSSTYLEALSGDDPAAEEELWTAIRGEARNAFALAADPLRRTADGLFRTANAGNWFERKLSSVRTLILSKPRKETRP